MSFLSKLTGKKLWAPTMSRQQVNEFIAVVDAKLKSLPIPSQPDFDTGSIKFEGGMVGYLDNLSMLCATAPKEDWPELVGEHFANVVASLTEGQVSATADFEEARGLIKTRLYNSAMPPELPCVQVAEGIVQVAVLELPSSFRSVTKEDMERWDKTYDELLEIGIKNVKDEGGITTETFDAGGGTVVDAISSDHFFAPTHLLFLSEHIKDLPSDGFFVAVPNRHLLLYHPIRRIEAKTALLGITWLAQAYFKEGPGSISPLVYWMRGESLVTVDLYWENKVAELKGPEELREVFARLNAEAAN